MYIKNKNKNTKNITKCTSTNVDENCEGKTDDKPIWKIVKKKKKITWKKNEKFFFQGKHKSKPSRTNKWKACCIFKLNSTSQWLNKINYQINLCK